MNDWNGKPYHSLDYELKKRFGTKVYKLSLDGGMTCPNRDGHIGTGGCIFCSAGGSGDFAADSPVSPGVICPDAAWSATTADHLPEAAVTRQLEAAVTRQLEAAAGRVRHKFGNAPETYIAYFQSYTNTYAPVSYLRALFTAALSHPQVRALSVATRPDCLPPEVLDLLAELNRKKPVWVELGLQTIHEDTARFIRRGYPLSCFEQALAGLRERELETIVHVILGLPGESREQMFNTVRYLAASPIQGIKLQLLHVLKGTDLARIYEQNPFPVFTMEEYIDLVIDCISLLPPDLVIHRITGDGPKSLLIAPMWSANKRLVLNSLSKRFRERGVTQGCAWDGSTTPFSST